MKRVILSVTAVLLLSIIAGCGGDSSSSKSTASSMVSINIGGNGQTASFKIEKNTFIARAGLFIRDLLPTNSALAAISQDVTKIAFTIDAPDIITIKRDVLISGQASVTETFIVPNGINRRILVEAKDTPGNVQFRKERHLNLDGTPVHIPIDLEDVAPPVFAGMSTATTVSASQIDLYWNPASDNLTSSSAIVYNIYVSKTSGGENFTSPSFVTSPGATTFSATGLESNTTYYFIVRAGDSSGNFDSNIVEKSATTFDGTPPVFAGLFSATPSATTSGRIDLAWNPATDNTTPSANIVYLIYMSTTSGAQNLLVPSFTTAPGATSFTITGLSPGIYYFVIRARDAAGNTDTNIVERSASSDIIPPSITLVNLVNVTAGQGSVAQITIDFSEPINNASMLNPNNYSVICTGDCSPITIDSISSSNNSSVTLTLSYAYACYMTFDLTVLSSITDLAGNPMTNNFAWTYFTGC